MPTSSCRRSRVEMSAGDEGVLPEMLARYSGRFAGACADAVPMARPVARIPAVSPSNVLLILPPFLAQRPAQWLRCSVKRQNNIVSRSVVVSAAGVVGDKPGVGMYVTVGCRKIELITCA